MYIFAVPENMNVGMLKDRVLTHAGNQLLVLSHTEDQLDIIGPAGQLAEQLLVEYETPTAPIISTVGMFLIEARLEALPDCPFPRTWDAPECRSHERIRAECPAVAAFVSHEALIRDIHPLPD